MNALDYQSPFDGDTDLTCTPLDGGMVLWAYQGIAAVMPAMSEGWTRGLRNWYTARRDANLMGLCLLCGAEIPAVTPLSVTALMLHDDDCALVSADWAREFRVQA